MTWVIVIEYQWNSDFVMNWYEFYPILVLLVIKMILQISYTFGPQYNAEEEWKPRIHGILTDKFGDAAEIIKMYLPRFNSNIVELMKVQNCNAEPDGETEMFL